MTPFKPLLAATTLVALGACTDTSVYRSYSEAGSLTAPPNFGTSTANNQLAMVSPEGAVLALANRFAEEVKPTVNFEFDSAVLDDQARATLRQQATWIKQFPEVRFRVYGHTDLVGSPSYNKQLGQRRANAAVNYLVSQGISRSRLEAVVSFGETQPLIVTQGRERRNRRTVTEVRGFVKNHPIAIDGKYMEVVHREYLTSAAPRSTLELVEEGGEVTGATE
ncbi:MAG: OmpA family protein [Pseudomonadota bacterium]